VVAFVREIVTTLVPAVILALFIHAFLAQSTIVLGQSMEPNLQSTQRLMVEKVSYWLHPPHRGDIVVLRDPTGGPVPLIKRVVGLPGERISIANGHVFVDGRALSEPYLNQITLGEGRSWVVPPMEIFVMGDNRSNSKDSRYFGPVSLDSVLGHAVFRFWPLNKLGGLP
jgi:signal peptidase I